MKSSNYFIFSILSGFLFFACSTSQQTMVDEKQKEPEIYVFDDVNKTDSIKTETPTKSDSKTEQPKVIEKAVPEIKGTPAPTLKKFIVQVGVFTSMDRARSFVKENQSKIAYLLNVSIREADKLFVVRLHPFDSREDAEKVRNNIWQIPEFKDAFIINPD